MASHEDPGPSLSKLSRAAGKQVEVSGSLADSVRIVTQRVRIVTNRCQDCYPKCQDCYPGCQDRYRECQDCQRRVRIVGVSLSKAEEDVSSVGNQRKSDSRPGTSSAGFVSKCQDCQRLVSGSLPKLSGLLPRMSGSLPRMSGLLPIMSGSLVGVSVSLSWRGCQELWLTHVGIVRR